MITRIRTAIHSALTEHRRTTVLVTAGILIVLVVSFMFESTNAVVYAGIIAGLFVGVAIASESARKESANLPPREPRSKRKKKN